MERREALDQCVEKPFFSTRSALYVVFSRQKCFAEAKEVYLKGIEKCPDSSDLHNNYGVFLVDTGEST